MRKYEWRVQEVVTSYQKHKENNPLLCEATLSVGGSVAACREMKLRTTLVFMFPSLDNENETSNSNRAYACEGEDGRDSPLSVSKVKKRELLAQIGKKRQKTNTCHGYGC